MVQVPWRVKPFPFIPGNTVIVYFAVVVRFGHAKEKDAYSGSRADEGYRPRFGSFRRFRFEGSA